MTDKAFKFTSANLTKAKKILEKYPKERSKSAVMPLLDLAQRQNDNWISQEIIEYVAEVLELPPIRVQEIVSFYTMYNTRPVGDNLIQLCGTTPCWLRKSDDILKAIKQNLGIKMGETTADGKFTLMEVECLGACVNAPVVQINDNFYEDLTPQAIGKILDALRDGKSTKIGSQNGRIASAPIGGLTSLKNL